MSSKKSDVDMCHEAFIQPQQMVLRLDAVTKSFLKLNPGIQITVTQCPKCGLWHDESLGHRCPKKGESHDTK